MSNLTKLFNSFTYPLIKPIIFSPEGNGVPLNPVRPISNFPPVKVPVKFGFSYYFNLRSLHKASIVKLKKNMNSLIKNAN